MYSSPPLIRSLSNTKAQDGKTTLVHFLANVIEEKHPDLVGFLDEFNHLDKAARGITIYFL
jgi:predicted SnoaL-like aldol condensation-catalyzing enzyme